MILRQAALPAVFCWVLLGVSKDLGPFVACGQPAPSHWQPLRMKWESNAEHHGFVHH